MIKNPYKATATRGYRTDKIERGLKEAHVYGETVDASANPVFGDSVAPNTVLELKGLSVDVPQFNHPFILDDGRAVIDTRAFYSKPGPTKTQTLNNEFDFKIALLRAGLTLIAYRDGVSDYKDLYNISELPLFVFVRWVSENLARRLGLDPEQQMKTTVVAGLYYHCMHTEEHELDERVLAKVATKLATVTRIPVGVSIEVAKGLSYMQSLEDFIAMLKRAINSPRLEDLNIGSAITILAASAGWRGVQAREIMSVALEHAPTWHTVMAMAITERSVSTTSLAKTLKFYRGRGDSSTYVKLLLEAIKDQ